MESKTNKIKDLIYLDKLSTKRLLAYYKARRKDRISFLNGHTCDCCGCTTWDFHPKEAYAIKAKSELDTMEKHLDEIKQLLAKREHIRR